MNYKVEASGRFDRDIKKLAKKYKSLKNELAELINSLEENPTQGTSLGQNCYKIRLAIRSKGTGKRGGSRVVTYVVKDDE
ncbi:type II toxin-antitoxin system RelE family toxin [Spirosoma areae]